MIQRNRIIFNAALFQVGWLSCVLGGNTIALVATLSILSAHFIFFSRQYQEWSLITAVGLLGFIIDSILVALGVLSFEPTGLFIPLWLLCLWILFACTLNHSLSWLKRWPLLAVLLGAIAGPSSYFAGSQLAGVELSTPLLFSLSLIAIIWATLLPALLKVFHYFELRVCEEH